jgi:hypothetical protein
MKRALISSSPAQMYHWKQTHLNKLNHLNVISESQFILHLKYLASTIGKKLTSFKNNVIYLSQSEFNRARSNMTQTSVNFV